MTNDFRTIDRLFAGLFLDERMDILRSAGIEIHPAAQLNRGSYNQELRNWIAPFRASIAPLLLRKRNVTTYEFAQMYNEGDLELYAGELPPVTVQITPPSDAQLQPDDDPDNLHFSLTDLVTATAFMGEMFIVIGSAGIGVDRDEPYIPPYVEVNGGSVKFIIKGGLFAAGIGMIVTATGGLAAAPIAGVAGGTALAGVGFVDKVFNWRHEAAKNRITNAEADLLELEVQQKKLELRRAEILMQQQESENYPAASSLIPRQDVQNWADRFGLREAFANHILNVTVPIYSFFRTKFVKIEADIDEENR